MRAKVDQMQSKEDKRKGPSIAEETWKGAKVDPDLVAMAEDPPRNKKGPKDEKKPLDA